MRLSIRNQFDGEVVDIARGKAMATVKIRLAGRTAITSAITVDALDDLGLTVGRPATVLIKATEVAVGVGPIGLVSIRNQIPATVIGVEHGAVMTTVKLSMEDGRALTAAVTREAAEDLGLADGDAVTALVKSTDVSVAAP
ncbi:TOBE domain-containing protein [Catellatospora citrea]|uniref:Molybdenum-binding protein n=1 Tax=Catellatospora citrea TaxID=53366 RepID=A0A8J3KMX1_9ACTN|nr:TOBE domain-containing protein [Catellatospora citrea]RKE12212.1 molybdate transport system regulatory protein [Catellatospora citrea]GIF98824.1 molybdenum-binding protein [Catellatospora citrea]